MERSEEGHVPHHIYEIEEKEGAKYDALLPKKDKETLIRERQYNPYQRVPAQVTIELFVISDKKHQERFGKTERLLGYLCVMVNSANLRYQDTVAPRVKLLLVGLERSLQTEPYLHGNDRYMDDTATIQGLTQYVDLKKREYGYPDAVYLITGLGAAHDGEPPMTELVPGHPGALGCPFNQGYIMSYINNGPNYHRFSLCSVRQIQFVLRLRGLSCWQVRSKGHTLDGYYPGMVVKPLDLCRYSLPGRADVKLDSVRCFSISTLNVWAHGPRCTRED
ncbi:hypothetical protein V5799_015544 [Amblyomma americanum]|uniref:Uncharacterized protein n=1 Tax=Amblyomma americanum TaxID=6943 RepID=A0AAQ4F8C3_AMBAM